ncbi:centrin-4, putative (CEN4) [Plasmodium ovale wallikeri]|uniref:Centrin-4, putative (CEN4) n=1 Tax=Plasmodium ovale wallikeri TaxID=864142 RepID=A0A1A8YTJ2_PLAOA|nr:centrin-4, putative (CEN4) [Plasmodium ovale wallikeri]SBT35285.1 centrin-4, putative (CEN4) [Plasmodium ovale wallikeri]
MIEFADKNNDKVIDKEEFKHVLLSAWTNDPLTCHKCTEASGTGYTCSNDLKKKKKKKKKGNSFCTFPLPLFASHPPMYSAQLRGDELCIDHLRCNGKLKIV